MDADPLLADLMVLKGKWREHEVDVWVECDCAKCAYETCADQLAALIKKYGK